MFTRQFLAVPLAVGWVLRKHLGSAQSTFSENSKAAGCIDGDFCIRVCKIAETSYSPHGLFAP